MSFSGHQLWLTDRYAANATDCAFKAAFRFDRPVKNALKSHPFAAAIHRQPVIRYEGVPKMNKNELISAVADASGLSKSDSATAVEAVFDTITRTLAKGDEVRLVGFGTFAVAKRKASMGRNPRTGEPMPIKASSQPKFKAGKVLKDSVN